MFALVSRQRAGYVFDEKILHLASCMLVASALSNPSDVAIGLWLTLEINRSAKLRETASSIPESLASHDREERHRANQDIRSDRDPIVLV